MRGILGLLDLQTISLGEITHTINGVTTCCRGEGESSPWLHDDEPYSHLNPNKRRKESEVRIRVGLGMKSLDLGVRRRKR